MPFSVSERQIKSKIRSGDRVVVLENIKYPFFEDEKNKKLCAKMNAFYGGIAEKYSYYARKKLPKKLKPRLGYKPPVTVSMSYTVSFINETIISIVLDLSFLSGKNCKTRRFSQMWSVEKRDIVPLGEVFDIGRQSRKRIYALVLPELRENAENPDFGYYADYLVRFNKSFDVRNSFAVPNGICFFINAGILSPKKYGVNGFVLSYDKLSDILKEGFKTKLGEKTP